MPVRLGQVRYISNVFGHVYKCFFFFVCFFFCTSISCIGVTPVDTYVVYILNMSWKPESFFFFLFRSFVCLFFCTRPHKCFSSSQLRSLLPLQTFCVFAFKSSCGHQIQILMAWHPFKNPLKALVTFRATCFCVFLF